MRTTVVAAVALASVLAGCGQGDGTEEVTVVQDLDLLQAAEAEGTARISVTMDGAEALGATDGPGVEALRMRMESEGTIAFGGSESTWSGTWSIEGVLPEGSIDEAESTPPYRFEEISLGDDRWTRVFVDGDEPPGWNHVDRSEIDIDGGEEGDALLADPFALDPATFLDELRDQAGTVTEVGEDEVRGDATTHYRAEIDPDHLHLDGLLEDRGDTMSVDVWVDDQERLRRVDAGFMAIELWDFGAPVGAEEPTDVADEVDLDALTDRLPRVTGEWAVEATGISGDHAWTIHAAPGEIRGTPTTCRTLELDGADPGEDPGGFDSLGMMGELPVPTHEGILATCGSSTFAALPGTFVAEPTVQVVPVDLTNGAWGDGPLDLFAFVVAPEHADDGLTLLREGADPVAVPLDGGIAVWDGGDSPPVTAIELDGGAIRCPFAAGDDEVVGMFDDEHEPGASDAGLGTLPPTCVEA